MNLRNRAILSLAVACLAIGSMHLFGQAAGTASISGRVLDASGGDPSASGVVKNTRTSASRPPQPGRYIVAELPIGSCRFEVSKAGFQNSVRSGIKLTVGSSPVIDCSIVRRAGDRNGECIGGSVELDSNSRAAAQWPEGTADSVRSGRFNRSQGWKVRAHFRGQRLFDSPDATSAPRDTEVAWATNSHLHIQLR